MQTFLLILTTVLLVICLTLHTFHVTPPNPRDEHVPDESPAKSAPAEILPSMADVTDVSDGPDTGDLVI